MHHTHPLNKLILSDFLFKSELVSGCNTTNPLLVDPTNGNFRLGTGSQCHNTGSDGGDMGYRYTVQHCNNYNYDFAKGPFITKGLFYFVIRVLFFIIFLS